MNRALFLVLCLTLLSIQAQARKRWSAEDELRAAFSDPSFQTETLLQLPGVTPEGTACRVSIMGLKQNPESSSSSFLLDVVVPEKKLLVSFSVDAHSDDKVLNSDEEELLIRQNDIHQSLNYWGNQSVGVFASYSPYTIHKQIRLELSDGKVTRVELKNDKLEALCTLK